MIVPTEHLTAERFLSLPRRGVVAPNKTGTRGLYSVSTHEFGKGTAKEWRMMNLATGSSYQITDDEKLHDVQWIPGSEDTIIGLRSGEGGITTVLLFSLADGGSPESQSHVGTIEAPVQALKLKALDDHSFAVAVIGLTDSEGGLYNEEAEKNTKCSTARIYDDMNVRECDTYFRPQKYAIFYSRFIKHHERHYSVSETFHNAVRGSGLEAPCDMYDATASGSPTDRYDICPTGIIFCARDPDFRSLKPQLQRASDVYFVPVDDWGQPPAVQPVKVALQADNGLGEVSNPRFSPDGSMVAYLKRSYSNEADNRLFMGHVGSLASFDVWKMVIGSSWDLVPEAFEYRPNGQSMFVTADNCGRMSLFELELRHGARPRLITKDGSVRGHYSFHDAEGDLKLLVSSSSHVESSTYIVHDPSSLNQEEPVTISTATGSGAKISLSPSQVEEIWFEGSEENCIQAWLLKPRRFDGKKKWPLVLMVHGGPQGACRDEWQWRWHAALWAEQGYVVVQPNFTGSTGFGIEFTEAIYNQWGGRPYRDVVHCMEHLARIPYVDVDRAVVAGGSYGGYMVNWILGQPLAKKFKAAISHSPIFDLKNFFLHSDQLIPDSNFAGPCLPWLNPENMDRWNPSRPDLLANWKHGPPTLFVHSDGDYRCPVTEGLAAFKALRCQGVEARLLSFPDETHWVVNHENALVWHRSVFEWMERMVLG
ncbi:prolyl oligopeptidase [Coniochaeta sp. 2T2.1]|nr:prolyl oligopeptidase [Coniochaeta sp. 2T2.1]